MRFLRRGVPFAFSLDFFSLTTLGMVDVVAPVILFVARVVLPRDTVTEPAGVLLYLALDRGFRVARAWCRVVVDVPTAFVVVGGAPAVPVVLAKATIYVKGDVIVSIIANVLINVRNFLNFSTSILQPFILV